jgi:hypothetical protein
MAIRSSCVICGEITSAPDATCSVCDPERKAIRAADKHEAREMLAWSEQWPDREPYADDDEP